MILLEEHGVMTTFKNSGGAKPVMAEFPEIVRRENLVTKGIMAFQRLRGRVWRNGENAEKNVNEQNPKNKIKWSSREY